MRCGHGRVCLCEPCRGPARRHSTQAMPEDGRDAHSAPQWKPGIPRLNTVLAVNLVLMLLGGAPAMASSATRPIPVWWLLTRMGAAHLDGFAGEARRPCCQLSCVNSEPWSSIPRASAESALPAGAR